MRSDNIFLKIDGLTKAYQSVTAVDRISFSVEKGEVFGLLGPNGAGKTTTINMLCGLLKSDAGDVIVDGMNLSTDYNKVKTIIGLCPQDVVIWEQLTCMEQMIFSGISYNMTRKHAKERSEYLLDILGLTDRMHKLAKTLSGGMKRRLNIALALVHDPKLIILDEPQVGLDPQSRILVRNFIRHLAKDKTVILTTHDMDEADRLSDRVAIIDRGKILMIDTPENLKRKSGIGDILQIRVEGMNETLLKRFKEVIPFEVSEINCSDGLLYLCAQDVVSFVPKISEILGMLGIIVQNMTIRKRTLEDAFIAMTGRGL